MSASSEQNEGIQKIVYGISHDMSAPLRAVVQFSQLLKNRLSDRLDEKETYWLQLIEENGSHAQKMIEALLTYSRLSTENLPEESFLLQDVLHRSLSKLDAQITEQSANIVVEGDWPGVLGCEQHWFKLFSEVLRNALLYQPKEINHKPQVTIRCEQSPGQVLVCIEDNGIGVKNTMLDVITTPFKRLHAEQDYPGIGMGLSYCERIAELLGGQLEIVTSASGGLAVTYSGPLD